MNYDPKESISGNFLPKHFGYFVEGEGAIFLDQDKATPITEESFFFSKPLLNSLFSFNKIKISIPFSYLNS